MAIYRVGRASMDAQGYVTGTGGTKWREQLTLIRSGATIVFLTSPSSFATISEVIADDRMRVVSSAGKVIPESDYVILLHDSLTVDGLAQDVAETLRYYQGKETQFEAFIEFLKGFDFAKLEQLTNETLANAAAAADSQKKAQQNETNTSQYKDQTLAAAQGAEQNKTLAGQYKDRAVQAEASANLAKDAAEASQAAAKAEADRAAQITGINTVYDAIGNASVPLPDVWIPLNDGLQMLAGYGEEVKVGEIVVAKMLKYDRAGVAYYTDKGCNLRRADANAPRCEKNGLLLEGQATNLISNSSTITTKYQYTDTGKTVSTPMNDGSNAVIYTAEAEGVAGFLRFGSSIKTTSDLTETRTSSCWVLSPDEDADIIIECEDKNAITFNVKAGVWTRISSTRTQAVASGGYINFFDVLIKYPRIGQKIVVWGGQLESSTAMTSYIHTTGTQLTRPQDFATIPYYKNACEDMSVAVEITAGAYIPPYSNWIVDFASNSNNERYAICYDNSGKVFAYGFGLAAAVVDGFSLNQRSVVVAVWRASDKQVSIYLNGKRGQVANGTQPPVIASHGLIRLMRSYAGVASNGNVRNLRIWHKALTEEQARAIR